jgi:hypothetical protein
MKPISASIVVLAAAILMAGGSQISHSDTQRIVLCIGGAVGIFGLVAWIISFREENEVK